jgi:hypothetical protein
MPKIQETVRSWNPHGLIHSLHGFLKCRRKRPLDVAHTLSFFSLFRKVFIDVLRSTSLVDRAERLSDESEKAHSLDRARLSTPRGGHTRSVLQELGKAFPSAMKMYQEGPPLQLFLFSAGGERGQSVKKGFKVINVQVVLATQRRLPIPGYSSPQEVGVTAS